MKKKKSGSATPPRAARSEKKKKGNGEKWVYPPLFRAQVGGGKMQTSSPPVITPNRSQSNPDDMITLPRPIQSVGMDLHDVSGTSTGQTLPRERRAPLGTHFCPTIWWAYPHSATIFILHPLLLSTFSSTFVRNMPTFDHSSTLKRRPQTSVTAGVGLRPAADHPQMVTTPGVWIRRTRAQDPCSCCCRPGVGPRPAADHPQMVTTPGVLDPADPRARALQLLLDISDKSG